MLSQVGLAVLFVVSATQFKPETMSPGFQEADAELNAVYKEMMAVIPEEARERLKAAQLAWLPYRDLASELEADFGARGGRAQEAFDASMTYLTRKQVQWLRLVYTGDWVAIQEYGWPTTVEQYASWLVEADKSLNRAYEEVVRMLGDNPQSKVKALQLKWLPYRDRMREFQEVCCKEPGRRQVYADALTTKLTIDQKIRLEAVLVPWNLDGILEALRGSESSPGKAGVVFGALGMRGKPAVPLLVALIKGDNRSYQESAVHTLAGMGMDAADAAPVLRQVLVGEIGGGAGVYGARRALGRMGNVGLPILMEILREREPNNSMIIAEGFRELGALAAPALMKDYETASPAYRINIARALHFVGPAARDAVPMLLASLEGADDALRAEIAFALGGIGEPVEVVGPALIELLVEPGVQKGEKTPRNSAAWALAQIRPITADAIAALKQTVLLQEYAARTAASSLALMDSEEAVLALVELADNPDVNVRLRVMEPLGRAAAKHPPAAAALADALNDPDDNVRGVAARALGETGESSIAPQLEALKDPEFSFVKAAGARPGFGALGVKALEPLRALLKSDDPEIRAKAALMGSAIQDWDSAGVPELIAKLSSADTREVKIAIDALGDLGARAHQAAKPLQALLGREDTAEAAKGALERIGAETEGIDYRLEVKEAGPGRDKYLRYQWTLLIDAATFSLAPIDAEQKSRWPDRYGVEADSLKVRWVTPGRFLEVFWTTCSQGSGRYLAYSTLLLEMGESGWREVFRHTGEGYSRGGGDDASEVEHTFRYDAATETLFLHEKARRVGEDNEARITEWPCVLSEGELKCQTGKEYVEFPKPVTLEELKKGPLDIEKLKRLNPGWDPAAPFSGRLVVADDVPPFEPYTGVLFSIGD